jgi:hypothetical protein
MLQYPIVRGLTKKKTVVPISTPIPQQRRLSREDPAVARLKVLFAEGKISEEEYLSKKKILEE